MSAQATGKRTDYFEETFVSPFLKPTEDEALKVLDAIREAHPTSKGWTEINGFVEKHEGMWRAVRVHRKIK